MTDKYEEMAREIVSRFSPRPIPGGALDRLRHDVSAALKQAADDREAECAKIICPNCRDGVPLKDPGTHVHTALSGATFEAACHAAAIRARG